MALAHRLGNPDLARVFTKGGPPLQLVVRIDPGSRGTDSYAWTSKRGEEIELASTTLVEGQVTVKSLRDGQGLQTLQSLDDVVAWAATLQS